MNGRKFALALVTASALVSFGAPALADAAAAKAEAKAKIWPKEEAIYAGRGRGDLGPYISFTDPDYAAWPAGGVGIVDVAALKKSGVAMAGRNKELISLEFIDLRVSGSTAVIYYRTHRTRTADGAAIDQKYDNTHTWVRDGDDWRIVGGLSRLVEPTK